MDSQCISTVCSDLKCKGFSEGSTCTEHKDCDAGLFCKKATVWPYTAYCSSVVSTNVECLDDYDCKSHLFCWYKTEADQSAGTKKCLEKWAKPAAFEFGWSASVDVKYSDQEQNGMHCVSGLASNPTGNVAKCVQVGVIKQNGLDLLKPYACNPTYTNNPCSLYYGPGANDALNVPCRCALDGQNGFCGSLVGTSEYEELSKKLKKAYSSSACHTLDRNNLEALKDACGKQSSF